MIRRDFLCRFALLWAAAPMVWPQTGAIRLDVDATDAPRRLIHVKMNVPLSLASPVTTATGSHAVTLLYPQWIPGEHGPTGPIADVVRLKSSAHGEAIPWRRDAKNLFSFTM